MKQIPLTQGKFAIVDDDDYERLTVMGKWCTNKKKHTFYAQKAVVINGKTTIVMIHRVILGIYDKDFVVDHVDGNGLNNTKANLRICTHSQNLMNKKTPDSNTSGYKGVSWNCQKNMWQVYIYKSKVKKYVGMYNDILDAAKAYNDAALKYYGEFAKLNKI